MAVESEDKILLAHVDRMWAAERENAERLAARVRMISPLCAAVLGFLLAIITRTEVANALKGSGSVTSPSLAIVFFSAAAVSISYLVRSLLYLLFHVQGATGHQRGVLVVVRIMCAPILIVDLPFFLLRKLVGDSRSDQFSSFASRKLDLTEAEIRAMRPSRGNPRSLPVIHWNALVRTFNASIDLRKKNLQERQRLRTAEQDMARGIIWLIFVVAVYLYAVL